MIGLYNDPDGETVFMSSAPISVESPFTTMNTDKETIESLRKRIRELEHDASQYQVPPCFVLIGLAGHASAWFITCVLNTQVVTMQY